MDAAIRVLHVASEMAPLVKLGGLGDVVGSLPKALREAGVDARVLLPCYAGLREHLAAKGFPLVPVKEGEIHVALNWRVYDGQVWETASDGVPVYLLDQPELFGDPQVYPRESTLGATLPFAFLSLGALELARIWKPDIFHIHDWPGGLLPAALAWHRHYRSLQQEYDTVLTIHNMAHQWILAPGALEAWGFGRDAFTMDRMEFFGSLNVLKGAIVASDAVTTVSPRYSWEIQTSQGGFGLHGVLEDHRGKLSGILNGLDYALWNPESDAMIPAPFSPRDMTGKGRCRQLLLERFGVEDDGRPILVFVGRLVEQKGVDILLASLEPFARMGARTLVLGSGHAVFENALREAASRMGGTVGVHLGYDEELAHLLYAGGDILLMPSLFEPCGLSQLIALRYGTIPVVRAVGGLADTVIDADGSDDGNGFVFSDYVPHEFSHAVWRALERRRDGAGWAQIQRRGMAQDYSWYRSAAAYAEVYRRLRGMGRE
ncbi:MAG TPA: glycogen synthase [Synergistaceae bacterium]|nr:glycogen synthase [Synergistaceae bacterium]HQH78103.1 glycogen synthase [Synergistaceae bacterium]HQK24484.1 glycogen synthase [Synergistaceae bacterium]